LPRPDVLRIAADSVTVTTMAAVSTPAAFGYFVSVATGRTASCTAPLDVHRALTWRINEP
jgi:hypothetical protein